MTGLVTVVAWVAPAACLVLGVLLALAYRRIGRLERAHTAQKWDVVAVRAELAASRRAGTADPPDGGAAAPARHPDAPHPARHQDAPHPAQHPDAPHPAQHQDAPHRGRHPDDPHRARRSDDPNPARHPDEPRPPTPDGPAHRPGGPRRPTGAAAWRRTHRPTPRRRPR